MKKFCLTLVSASVLASFSAHADLFDDVQFWVGSGSNEAAFEIDWNNGTANSTLVWGYRWDGDATGEQMLNAIVAADPRLYAEVSTPGYFGGLGSALFGLGYHPSGDQNFQLDPSLTFNNQHLAYTTDTGVDDSRTAVTAGDQWQEGWFNAGYWSYYLSTDSRLSSNYTDWDYSGVGMSSRMLANGDVDGWSFAYDFSGPTPAVPLPASPVPEPTTWAILFLGGLSLVCFNINRHVKKVT